MKKIREMKAFETQGNPPKKKVFAASLPNMQVETPLFGRERCPYVERCHDLKISCEFKTQAK
jgi:hypothetical protein